VATTQDEIIAGIAEIIEEVTGIEPLRGHPRRKSFVDDLEHRLRCRWSRSAVQTEDKLRREDPRRGPRRPAPPSVTSSPTSRSSRKRTPRPPRPSGLRWGRETSDQGLPTANGGFPQCCGDRPLRRDDFPSHRDHREHVEGLAGPEKVGIHVLEGRVPSPSGNLQVQDRGAPPRSPSTH